MVPTRSTSGTQNTDQTQLMDHIDEIIAITYSRLDIDKSQDLDRMTQFSVIHQSDKKTLDEILYDRLS